MSTNGTYKFVALLNKTLEPGVALNALGHMALGLSAALASEQREAMQLLEFVDGDGQSHSHISALSLIVLRGTSGNVRALRDAARRAGLPCVDFTKTMTGGTYTEQLERTRTTAAADLEYYGVMVFGEAEELNPITKKYSLYR